MLFFCSLEENYDDAKDFRSLYKTKILIQNMKFNKFYYHFWRKSIEWNRISIDINNLCFKQYIREDFVKNSILTYDEDGNYNVLENEFIGRFVKSNFFIF